MGAGLGYDDMAFQKGDLDILDRIGMNYLMLNEKIEPLADVSVRRAIQMAIDRETILNSIYGGDGKLEDGVYPTGCLGYCQDDQGWLKYDPEEAKKLLAEADYANGFDMELALDSGAADTDKNTVQIIAQNLKDIGINATVKAYDHASWLDLRNSGDMNAFLAVWILDYNDPDNIIYTFFGNKENTVIRSNNYTDTETISRAAAARAIVSSHDRMDEYAALEKKLVEEDAVWVPMYSLRCYRACIYRTSCSSG